MRKLAYLSRSGRPRRRGDGDRLRLDIYSADTPNHLALLKPALNPIFFGPDNDSYIALPVVPN